MFPLLYNGVYRFYGARNISCQNCSASVAGEGKLQCTSNYTDGFIKSARNIELYARLHEWLYADGYTDFELHMYMHGCSSRYSNFASTVDLSAELAILLTLLNAAFLPRFKADYVRFMCRSGNSVKMQ